MERRALHKDGPEFSRIVAGAWRWTLEDSAIKNLIHRSLEAGVTTFDHADIYGDHSNEEIFGKVIKQEPALRHKMELVTKCGIKLPSTKRPHNWIKHYDTSKENIIASVENSLIMLATDRIDLLLIHRPDPLLTPHEVAEAFSALRQSGKVLHFGVSNFTASQFEMLQHFLSFPLVTNQLEISVLKNAPLFDGSLDVLMKHEVAPMAWSPLGGGDLFSPEREVLFSKAAKYNASKTQLALAWLLRHPSCIFPVVGTTNPDRIDESARSTEISVDTQDWFEMLAVAQGKEVP